MGSGDQKVYLFSLVSNPGAMLVLEEKARKKVTCRNCGTKYEISAWGREAAKGITPVD